MCSPEPPRFRVARDGVPLWVGDASLPHTFKMEAHRDWLDFEPMLRVHDRAQRQRLAKPKV